MIEYYGLNTSQFEKKIFSSNGSIRTVLNRGSGLNVSTVTRILENCPEISPDWLLLGKGEMLRQKTTNGGHLPTGSLPTPYQLPANSLQAPFQTVQPSALPDTSLADENKMLRDNNAALLKHIGLLEDELSRLKLQLSTEREKTKSSSAPTPMEPISA